jgi:hypothetical protein
MILDNILYQNCSEYTGKFYKPIESITVGSPVLGIIAEIFILYLEQEMMKHAMEKLNI